MCKKVKNKFVLSLNYRCSEKSFQKNKFQKNHFRATTRVAPTERFVGATLVVALLGVII
jgi:hypothetical protein